MAIINLRRVCWTAKYDLSSTTKFDQTHSIECYEFGHTYLRIDIGHTEVLLKRDLHGQHNRGWFVEQKAPALGVTKFATFNAMSLVTPCCAT